MEAHPWKYESGVNFEKINKKKGKVLGILQREPNQRQDQKNSVNTRSSERAYKRRHRGENCAFFHIKSLKLICFSFASSGC